MIQLVAKIARTADMSSASGQTMPQPNIAMAFKSSIPRPMRKVQVQGVLSDWLACRCTISSVRRCLVQLDLFGALLSDFAHD